MKTIEVNGKKYTVKETFSSRVSHLGLLTKIVKDETIEPSGENVAVKDGGIWRWWTLQDKLRGEIRQMRTR